MPEVAHASMNSSAVTYSVRFRRLCRPIRANGERRDGAQCAGQPGERAELDRPFRRREMQQQQADRGCADQPPGRAAGHARDAAAAQQHDQHAEQAQQHDQHGEAPRHRPLGVVFHREEVIAQELLIPGDRRADLVLDPRRLGDGGKRLRAEHHDDDQRQRRGQHRQRCQQAVSCLAPHDDPCDRPRARRAGRRRRSSPVAPASRSASPR